MRIRDNKGSITMFVLVGVLFMSGFLLLAFGNNVNKSKISQEQFDIISDIYSYKDGNEAAYNRAYEALRSKNKQIMPPKSVKNSNNIKLTQTFEEKLVNYKIYGPLNKKITIEVTNGKETREYTITLPRALGNEEYIDYKTDPEKVYNPDGTEKETISEKLPDIYAYEENTTIKVTSGTPSKIEIEYYGYTI